MGTDTFISPYGCGTPKQAQYVLGEIRRTHPKEEGWVELMAGIRKKNGKYYAWRKHYHVDDVK